MVYFYGKTNERLNASAQQGVNKMQAASGLGNHPAFS